jgi:hypothetical protein
MNQKPLTKERIKEIWEEASDKTVDDWREGIEKTFKQQFAEAIEREHGIK